MIIGPDNKGGVSGAGLYSNANSSITGNHNPNTIGSATFYLNIAGVTVDSTISSVKFLFGTGPDGSESGPNVGVVPPSVTVPEPATLSLAGMALLGAAGFCSRRRKHA